MSGRVFWDTNLFIYWIEQHPPWHSKMLKLLAWQESRNLKTITSSLTLAEILVRPISLGHEDVARNYRQLLEKMDCLSFGPEEAWMFAQIRSKFSGVKPPDGIQLACAAVHGVEWFLTNDSRLKQVRVPGISRIASLDAVLAADH